MSIRCRVDVCRESVLVVALLLVQIGTAVGQGQREGQAIVSGNFCTVCHSDTQVEFRESVHSREGMTCGDCHGGDPDAQTAASAHSRTFKRAFARKQISELCSRCHSDAARMKPYGIPIDQFALYQTSVHGKRLSQGDDRVAICSDCHGVHKVLSVEDPRSPAYLENIPQTCGRCHEDAELMKEYHLRANVVSEYRQSVHGRALLERHNSQAPQCARCHGTHGAAPPGIGDVGKVCGQCHSTTLEHFRNGPHATSLATGSLLECASCHGDHQVEAAGHQMWSASCTGCHESQSPEASRGQKIQALFVQAEEEIEKARRSIEEARQIPLDVGDYEAGLTDAMTYLVEARPVSHDLSVEDAENLTRRSRSIALGVQSEIHEKVAVFRSRTVVLLLIWFYILISVAIVYNYRRLVERRQGGAQPVERPVTGTRGPAD